MVETNTTTKRNLIFVFLLILLKLGHGLSYSILTSILYICKLNVIRFFKYPNKSKKKLTFYVRCCQGIRKMNIFYGIQRRVHNKLLLKYKRITIICEYSAIFPRAAPVSCFNIACGVCLHTYKVHAGACKSPNNFQKQFITI